MNRTALFLLAAGALALGALVVGLPHRGTTGGFTPADLTPTVAGRGPLSLKPRLSHPLIDVGSNEVFVTVEVSAAEVANATRAPVNLAVVIDRSGSMSGFKLAQAKLAARQLVSQLDATDRLAIIDYGSDVRTFASQFATDDNKRQMAAHIDAIWDDGGTNIGSGLSAARMQLSQAVASFRVNRVILISDGQPTEGLTDSVALTDLARQMRQEGLSVSAIGVGLDFNEDLMQSLAQSGAGSYGFLQDASRLTTLFERDLKQAGLLVARNAALTFELPEGVTLDEVFGYPATRSGNEVTVALPDFASGQSDRLVARLHVNGTAVNSVMPLTHLSLSYTDSLANLPAMAEASLRAQVTDQHQLVLNARDKEAFVYAARARSAANAQRAAESLQQGDKGQALKLFESTHLLFDEAAAVSGEDSLRGDRGLLQKQIRSFSEAGSTDDVQQVAKDAKREARIGYGLSDHTY